jgi:hypothetical protein
MIDLGTNTVWLLANEWSETPSRSAASTDAHGALTLLQMAHIKCKTVTLFFASGSGSGSGLTLEGAQGKTYAMLCSTFSNSATPRSSGMVMSLSSGTNATIGSRCFCNPA